MAFNESEIAEYSDTLERCFWSHHRPPLHLRDKIREGHRLKDQSIELFFIRPAFRRPGEEIEEPIAKLSFVRSRSQWQIYWRRANGKWYSYEPHPVAHSPTEALSVVHEDAYHCFFG